MKFVKLVDKPPKGLSFVGVKKITDTAGFEPLNSGLHSQVNHI